MINGQIFPLLWALKQAIAFYTKHLKVEKVFFCFAIIYIACCLLRRKVNIIIQIKSIIISAYMTLVLCITILGRDRVEFEYNFVNLFKTYVDFFNSVRYVEYDILFNILLFVPLGSILLVEQFSFKGLISAAFFIAFAIELAQLLFSVGRFEIPDIFHNCLGALFGWFIAKAFRLLFLRFKLFR